MYSKAWFTCKAMTLEEAGQIRKALEEDHSDMKCIAFEITEKRNAIGDVMHYLVYIGVSDGSLDDD